MVEKINALKNQNQLDRYKLLMDFIHQHFKEKINIEKIEQISLYSYRNINRIFQALHQETIGKYIKRLRLEKAAEYLKYSTFQVSDIALEVGFSDVAAFSKAFHRSFQCSPMAFRKDNHIWSPIEQAFNVEDKEPALVFEIEDFPAFEMLYLEHRGHYDNTEGIKATWEQLIAYAEAQNLFSEQTVFFAEILDDETISDTINCRYHAAISLGKSIDLKLEGLFKTRTHPAQRYARFLHQGPDEQIKETYHRIYKRWLWDVQLDFADMPILEVFVNHHEVSNPQDLKTEIYIPVS